MAKRKRAGASGTAAKRGPADLASLLAPAFVAKHIGPALTHYTKAVEDFSQSDWEGLHLEDREVCRGIAESHRSSL